MVKIPLLVILPLGLLALPGILVVDVHEGGPDGNRIIVPVPVVLAQLALPFVPHEARSFDCPPELEKWYPLAERFLTELRDQPDFTLVEVTSPREHVLVRKVGRDLHVDVQERHGEEIHCRVPLRCADRVLKACRNGRLNTSELARALWSLPSGDLVNVRGEGEQVRIWKL